MSFGDGLLAALSDRPSEKQLSRWDADHGISKFPRGDNLHVECTCGGGVVSAGRDESSRNAINFWVTMHKQWVESTVKRDLDEVNHDR